MARGGEPSAARAASTPLESMQGESGNSSTVDSSSSCGSSSSSTHKGSQKEEWWRLVPASAGKVIRDYRYNGKDLSLLYKYFLSPFAERCLKITPLWLAPNLITFLGLLVSILGAVVFCIVCPEWESHDAPRWLLPFMGVCLFVYQTLDNLDGKQARRTGTGSALGLLFDHGCDAINATFGTFILVALTSPGFHLPSVAFCFGNNVIPFYFATWEHYYTEILVLPIINGPSEGVIIGVVLSFISCFTGTAIWQTPVPIPPMVPVCGGLTAPLWVVMMSGSYVGIVLTCLQQSYTVFRLRVKQNKSLWKPLLDLLPLVLVMVCGAQWLMLANDTDTPTSAIGRQHQAADVSRRLLAVMGENRVSGLKIGAGVGLGGLEGRGGGGNAGQLLGFSELFALYPYRVLALFGSIMGEAIIALMLAHMVDGPFQPFRLIAVPLLFAVVNGTMLAEPLVSNEQVLLVYSAAAVAWLALYVVMMVVEISTHLNIYVFSTRKRGKAA